MKRYTVRETAGFLGLSVETLRRRIRDGSIPAINVSNGKRPTYRIKAETLQEYESSRLTTNPKRKEG